MHGSEYVHSAAIKGRPSGVAPLVFGIIIHWLASRQWTRPGGQITHGMKPGASRQPVPRINAPASAATAATRACRPEQRPAATAAPKSCQGYPAQQPAA